ncbi:unnamed protein product [Paramecium primaurelia]|uniref:Uncharacterized protein n=1 Tax=Paramecium primaurelia TaxID=5886 RepID=A0A8S1NS02_PARPR|nr:unnamed protein product [Paramecium primaurelia]CAD8092293.1 unnamed protein product [Paramecium primaurelia]
MSEIFEHSKLIEHLFAGRQPKLARIERKTTLEQYLSSNQDTIDNQEEDQESQSSIKFLPDTTDILGDQDAYYLIQKLFQTSLYRSNIILIIIKVLEFLQDFWIYYQQYNQSFEIQINSRILCKSNNKESSFKKEIQLSFQIKKRISLRSL